MVKLSLFVLSLLVAADAAQAQSWESPVPWHVEGPLPLDPRRGPDGVCNDCLPPYFGTLHLDLMILQRSDHDSATLVEENGVGEVFNARDLDLDPTAAFRLMFTCHGDGLTELQFGYLGSRLQTTHNLEGTALRTRLFNGQSVATSTTASVDYESDLDSGEFNVRWRHWPAIVPLLGFRLAQLEDSIALRQPSGELSAEADNELYGLQIGLEAALCQRGRWRCDGSLKAGIYANDLEVMGHSDNIDFALGYQHATFLGEANLLAVYRLGPHLSFRVGTQLIWLDGVAQITDQYDNFDLFAAPVSGRPDWRTLIYWGGLLGVDVSW